MATQITVFETTRDDISTLADLHCLGGIEALLNEIPAEGFVKCVRGYAHDNTDLIEHGDAQCCKCEHIHDFDEPCPQVVKFCGRIDCCQP